MPHNLGRILSFTVLGALFGALGSFVNTAAGITGFQAAAGFVGGALMILWAVDELRTGHGGGILERWSLLGAKPVQRMFRRLSNRQHPIASLISGRHSRLPSLRVAVCHSVFSCCCGIRSRRRGHAAGVWHWHGAVAHDCGDCRLVWPKTVARQSIHLYRSGVDRVERYPVHSTRHGGQWLDLWCEPMAVLTCHLCEEPVVHEVSADGHAFCCHGCRDLWRLLGEEQIALLKSRPGVDWRFARSRSSATPTAVGGADPQTVALHLEGIWCASCGVLVEQVLLRSPGVLGVHVHYADSSAEVAMDAELISVQKVCDTITALGYRATPEEHGSQDGSAIDRMLLRRFVLSAAVSVVLMMLSVPVWSGYLPALPQAIRLTLMVSLWTLTTPVVFWSGWPFLRGAWTSLRHRVATMDLLISIASLAAYAYSLYNLWHGGSYLYFDTCSLLITFLLLGRNLEAATRNRGLSVTRLLSRLVVKDAVVVRDGQELSVPVADVAMGEVVVVRPGQRIPVDGSVQAGESAVDESFLTGEALVADKRAGDVVYAGSINHNGRILVAATRLAQDTLLAQTMRYVKAAQGIGGTYRRLTDRVLRVFVPVVLMIGMLTFVVWMWMLPIGPAQALLRAIAALVIACPCALSVAAPVAVLGGTRVLAEHGVLLRSNDALERAAQISAIVFDKTGTLTVRETCPATIRARRPDTAPVGCVRGGGVRAPARPRAGPGCRKSRSGSARAEGVSRRAGFWGHRRGGRQRSVCHSAPARPHAGCAACCPCSVGRRRADCQLPGGRRRGSSGHVLLRCGARGR